jgi:hypothetical protein
MLPTATPSWGGLAGGRCGSACIPPCTVRWWRRSACNRRNRCNKVPAKGPTSPPRWTCTTPREQERQHATPNAKHHGGGGIAYTAWPSRSVLWSTRRGRYLPSAAADGAPRSVPAANASQTIQNHRPPSILLSAGSFPALYMSARQAVLFQPDEPTEGAAHPLQLLIAVAGPGPAPAAIQAALISTLPAPWPLELRRINVACWSRTFGETSASSETRYPIHGCPRRCRAADPADCRGPWPSAAAPASSSS